LTPRPIPPTVRYRAPRHFPATRPAFILS
jgi:hypothetical protein